MQLEQTKKAIGTAGRAIVIQNFLKHPFVSSHPCHKLAQAQ